jgi:hypothetical protein
MLVQEMFPSLVMVDDCSKIFPGLKVAPLPIVRELDWRIMEGTVRIGLVTPLSIVRELDCRIMEGKSSMFRIEPVFKVSEADCNGESVGKVILAPSGRVTFALFLMVRLSNLKVPDIGVVAPAMLSLSISRSP